MEAFRSWVRGQNIVQKHVIITAYEMEWGEKSFSGQLSFYFNREGENVWTCDSVFFS